MENENVETELESKENVENMDNVDELKVDNSDELDSEEVLPGKSTDDFKEKYYYIAAEMQNMQRRFDKEKESLLKYGTERILRDILDVVDNFERTLGFIQADKDEKVKNIAVGIDMIAKQFVDTLGSHGLKKVNALGEIFDPNFHEALSQEKVEGKTEMEIIQVHQTGYTLNERLLRPAKVVVVKNS